MYVGRFAPSPTGPLHFGSLVAALASYADAKKHNGKWLLRIEDVDEGRTQPQAIENIISSLSRYGFRWDDEIETQSRQKHRYETALTKLNTCGAIYVCRCTRKQLEGEPLNASGERLYPGTCRMLNHAPVAPHAWRVRVPDEIIVWQDRHFGVQSENLARDVGDFVVKRADGLFAYQLAVVVDDAARGVNHIVRGADLLPSTSRQIYLQRLLKLPAAQYLHVPVVTNTAGEKLSKQTNAAALPADAVLPTLLRAWEALGQSAPQVSISSPEDFLNFAGRAWQFAHLPKITSIQYRE